jgi:hypothetical protein
MICGIFDYIIPKTGILVSKKKIIIFSMCMIVGIAIMIYGNWAYNYYVWISNVTWLTPIIIIGMLMITLTTIWGIYSYIRSRKTRIFSKKKIRIFITCLLVGISFLLSGLYNNFNWYYTRHIDWWDLNGLRYNYINILIGAVIIIIGGISVYNRSRRE